jgi:hypothetical protein
VKDDKLRRLAAKFAAATGRDLQDDTRRFRELVAKKRWNRMPIFSRRAIEAEHEREFFSDLAAKLAAGARGDSVMLSTNEFAVLLRLVEKPPAGR